MTGASEESVFAKALEIDDVQERAAFLDRACAGNPALRKNVLSLLSAYGAGQFLERPAPALAGTTDERSNATGCFLGGKVRKSAMAIHVQCPRCHALSHVDVTSATAVISCPRCQAKLPRLGDFATAPAPAQVGRFRVRRELGAGVSGTVYEAYDPELAREVALKVPHPGLLASASARERFLREARSAAQLRHPHIVPVYEASNEGPRPYIASEFIQGRTLQDVLEEARPKGLGLRRSARLVRELAEALAYAHGQGIVHRDVKPGNIMVDARRGQVHLADFGLALLEDAAERLTKNGVILGTPAYMAPEQAGGGGQVGPASDQYSAGVVLYELLCGQLPFTGRLDQVIYFVKHHEPLSPRRRNPRVPRDLETICLKAMAKDPARRYADCQQLADDLRRWLEGEPIHARRVWPGERLARWCRRNPLVAGLAAAVTLVLVATAGCAAYFAVRAEWKAAEAEASARQAREAKHLADQNAALWRQEQERANEKAVEAAASANEAREAQRRADEEAARAREAKRRSDRYLYLAHMNLAQQAWHEGQFSRVVELLGRHRPAPAGAADLRGFEWHYLWDLCPKEPLPLKGHARAVLAVCFSPDGTHIASASQDGTVRVWDAKLPDRKPLLFEKHAGAVLAVCYSPDGKHIASAGNDKVVWVWDAETGKEVFPFKEHHARVTAVCYSPNGKLIVSAGDDKLVRVWDARTGHEELAPFKGHTDSINAVASSPDGRRLASASDDGTVRVWFGATSAQCLVLRPSRGREKFASVCFTPDGRYVVAASADNAWVWDAQIGQVADFHVGEWQAGPLVFSPTGRRVACAGRGELKLFETQTGREIVRLPGQAGAVLGLAFSPDGTRLASAGKDQVVKVWDVAVGHEALVLKAGGSGPVSAVRFSPDGGRLAAAYKDQTVRVWDPETAQLPVALKGRHDAPVCGVVFDPHGGRLASAAEDGTVRVWDAQAGQQTLVLKGHAGPVFGLCFSPDGLLLASAGQDKTVKLWDAKTGAELASLEGHTDRVNGLCFSGDGRLLASAGGDGTVRVWDTATRKEVRPLKGHDGPVLGVCFSPDGRRIASAGQDHTVRVWDTQTGQEVFQLPGHTDRVNGVCFSPDGQRIASAGGDRTVKLWDAQSGQETFTLQWHIAAVNAVCFSPDGTRLASASEDETVRLWDGTPLK